MGAGPAEHDPERVRERADLPATLSHPGRAFCERLAAACAHLGFGRDQLADEMVAELGSLRGLLELLEAVDE